MKMSLSIDHGCLTQGISLEKGYKTLYERKEHLLCEVIKRKCFVPRKTDTKVNDRFVIFIMSIEGFRDKISKTVYLEKKGNDS